MKKVTRFIGWSFVLGSILYFAISTVYWIGYEEGKESAQCGVAQCMSYVIQAEQKTMTRLGWR